MSNIISLQEFGLQDRHGVPMVSSRSVAKKFGKQHGHVMRDIENLIEDLSKIGDISRHNFAPSAYKDEYGRKQPEYLMTRDGFTLLAMGFTGKKALQFKTAYIAAFNQMESFIKDQSAARLEYRPMTDAIQAAHDPAKFYHYATENDMLYRIVLGVSSKQFREQHGLGEGISPKVHMTPAQISLFTRLQRSNTDLIQMGIEYQRRKEMLNELAGKIKTPLLKAATG